MTNYQKSKMLNIKESSKTVIFKTIAISSLLMIVASNSPLKMRAEDLTKSLTQRIDERITSEVKKNFPSVSQIESSIPKFLGKAEEKYSDIKVSFPSGIHNEKLIAQVWVKQNGEEILYAVPVKIALKESPVTNEITLANGIYKPSKTNKGAL
ncbi:MAG: hypothetical protein SFU25_04030 [Candidatus Caenarcaniphilales bacterium]|nr:hypothetical protein [Candidatus Caenarcaniphilales bacterium]